MTGIDRTGQGYRGGLRPATEIASSFWPSGDARFDEIEVEGVLAFAEYVFGNLAGAAAKLQLHRQTIYEAIRGNRLRHVRVGKRAIRIREAWLDDMLTISTPA